MTKKDVGVIIEFDDKEYSPEECSFLYVEFFHALSNLSDSEIPKELLQKVFPSKIFKKR